MRRMLSIAALLFLLSASACGKVTDVTDYLSLPFSSEVVLKVDSSEYLLKVEKGGADLVSVTVVLPEALEGLSVTLGEGNAVSYHGAYCSDGMPCTVAGLIYAAFDTRNVLSSASSGDTSEVRFATPLGEGKLTFDTFSAVPLSLETEGVYMEFKDFKR